MTWLLTAKSGVSRGESWTIGPRPIVLGRSLSCDITIGDPTVSRKHCEVRLDGESVYFRDLGSRNVSLVNGRAVEECRLLVGDELSLGTESFILTRTSVSGPGTPSELDPRSSTTISLDEAVFLREDPEKAYAAPAYPSSVQDLVRLHHFGRKLSKAHTEFEFATFCLQELEEAFPARIKSAVCCTSGDELRWYPKGFVPTDNLVAQVKDVMATGEASMSSFRAKRLFFKEVIIAGAAPLHAVGRCYGALIIQSMARDYIPEPGVLAHLNALAQSAGPYLGSVEYRETALPDAATAVQLEPVQFLGQSAAVEALRVEIQEAASTGMNTLITGEPGTGKELAAHLVHSHGPAPERPLVSVNCMTIAGPGFVTALSGSEQPGGDAETMVRRGLLEQASNGTLLLRELDALTSANQLDLLRMLERRSYTRTGGKQNMPFQVRILATSSRDMEQMVSRGEFRRDLLTLIGSQRIHIKPLRRRPTDIRTLAQYFMDAGKRQGDHALKGITDEAMAYLEELPLRGNALELRSTITQAAMQSQSEWLDRQDIRNATAAVSERKTELEPLENAERSLIGAVLAQCEGNMNMAAEILGLPLSTVQKLAAGSESGRGGRP